MVDRAQNIEALKADMHKWYWESTDKIYKKLPRYYDKMVTVKPMSAMEGGGYTKTTSAIGASQLQDLDDYGKAQEDNPLDGFPVYGVIKQKSLKIIVPREVDRDMVKTRDYLKQYIADNWVEAIEVTKERIVGELYSKGGFTAGAAIFNNDKPEIGLTTYSNPNLCYDGAPMFNLTGNARTAKNAATYYNAVALADVSYQTANTMWTLLTSTNAYRENGVPFDNGSDLRIICQKGRELAWKQVNNSTLNPDNGQNATNSLQGAFKEIIANPYLTPSGGNFEVMQNGKSAIELFLGDPKFKYWEIEDPEARYAKVTLDYIIFCRNFRPMVANNAPVS